MKPVRLLQIAALAALWLSLAGNATAKDTRHKESEASLRAKRDAAQAAIKAHQQAAATAAAHRAAIAAKAAILAQQQVQAAAALRGLEDQTSQDATQLALLLAQQDQAAARLSEAEAALKKLLPVMQRLSSAPATTLLAAPLPPQDAVRGVAILQGMAAEVAAQAATVKTETASLAASITQAQTTRMRLDAAVAAQQAAEAKLSAAITQAQQDEQADADKQVAEAAAAAKARHELTSLNAAIARLVPKAPPHATPVNLPAGGAGAPVAGRVVQAYGAKTLAGPATGISYAAAPGARVISPCAGTVMYAGPLTGYGNVIITDCGGGLATVLAGMSHLDVAQGQHVVHGQPVGSMQTFDPTHPAHQPRLYVELRRNGTPINPTSWLAAGHSG